MGRDGQWKSVKLTRSRSRTLGRRGRAPSGWFHWVHRKFERDRTGKGAGLSGSSWGREGVGDVQEEKLAREYTCSMDVTPQTNEWTRCRRKRVRREGSCKTVGQRIGRRGTSTGLPRDRQRIARLYLGRCWWEMDNTTKWGIPPAINYCVREIMHG